MVIDIKLMSHNPTKEESGHFDKQTYVLTKKERKWNFTIYENRKKVSEMGVDTIDGLSKALATLPDKSPEQLSNSEIAPVKKILVWFHNAIGRFLGLGNGREITHSINTYLVEFFNTCLKGEVNPAFDNCNALSKDTYTDFLQT